MFFKLFNEIHVWALDAIRMKIKSTEKILRWFAMVCMN
jgi:hypothetical protein